MATQSAPTTRARSVRRFLGVICTLAPLLASAEIYRWTDEQGKVHFGDRAPAGRAAEQVELRINTYTSVSYATSTIDTGAKVLMYSTSWCGYCKRARRYFEAHAIPFEEFDVERDAKARARYRKLGARGVPVIFVGKRRMNGFTEEAFRRLYDG
ncbi:MAG: glutaredoxin family protein [Chromatiaceae bacterium]|nr:glutaredoxin family protein [Chromatiaceae bacterium]MCP5315028.1 glutaredoxin family protein [Chromatiaceae bacterium]